MLLTQTLLRANGIGNVPLVIHFQNNKPPVSLLLQHAGWIMCNGRSRALPLGHPLLSITSFLFLAYSRKDVRSLWAVITPSRIQQQLHFAHFLSKAMLKRTARSLEVVPAYPACFNQLTERFVSLYNILLYWNRVSALNEHLSLKHGQFEQFKWKLGMWVGNQHRIKLFCSSKLCLTHI